MSLQHIRTAIDPDLVMKGDVVIVKRTYVQGREFPSAPKLLTRCTNCSHFFPTQYRRMGKPGTPRGCEVRNVPQCSPCRSRYRKGFSLPAGFSLTPITDPSRLLSASSLP